MARYTVAYSSYLNRISEVELLQKKALKLEMVSAIENVNEIKALCRSSIVLLTSHVEGYVKDLAEISLDSIYRRAVPREGMSAKFFHAISKHHFDDLRNTSDPEKLANKIFLFLQEDYHYWQKQGPFTAPIPSDRFLKGFASPSLDKISSFLSRFGYSNLKSDLKSKLGADYHSVSNMIENVVSTRNNIAHGDSLESRTPSDLGQMIALTGKFCRATDDVFAGWASKAICPIR